MIKSKRKSVVFSDNCTKATWFVDKLHNWDYIGHSNKLGGKYKSNNNFVTKSTYWVNNAIIKNEDLIDA